jgi:hypothetical protein
MKTKIPHILILAAIMVIASVVTAEANSLEIYVAPDGDDAIPGTLDQPLRSFLGARNKVREMRDGVGNIVIYFREGTYLFE